MRAIEDPTELGAWTAINDLAATTTLHLQVGAGPVAHLTATRAKSADAVIAHILDRLMHAIATRRWDRLGGWWPLLTVFSLSSRRPT